MPNPINFSIIKEPYPVVIGMVPFVYYLIGSVIVIMDMKENKIMNKRRRRAVPYVIIAIVVLIIASAGIYIYFDNNRIDVSCYDVSVRELPDGFEGYKIAQISDFHNTVLGKDNAMIVDALEADSPDIIVITGDYTDSRRTDKDIVIALTEKIVKLAPVYYVTGNHERRIPETVSEVENKMEQLGVHILHNRSEYIERNGEKLQIAGVDDLSYYIDINTYEDDALLKIDEQIKDINSLDDKSCPTVLLSHRPTFFEEYTKTDVDLIFSGHEHGGQFRLPFIGAVLGPDEGFFPKYGEGVHVSGDCTMVVSRGLGQSIFPFRLNNSPELVFAVLHRK